MTNVIWFDIIVEHLRKVSSVGRASALQAEGHRFEPCTFHQSKFLLKNTRNGLVAQLVRALACHARGRGFEPHPSRHFSEYMPRGFSSFGRAPPCQGGGGGFEPRNPLQKTLVPKNESFFIQVADLVYHHRTKCGVYHLAYGEHIITRQRVLLRQAWIFLFSSV